MAKNALTKKNCSVCQRNTKIIIVTRLVDIIFCELKKLASEISLPSTLREVSPGSARFTKSQRQKNFVSKKYH